MSTVASAHLWSLGHTGADAAKATALASAHLWSLGHTQADAASQVSA